MSHPGRHLLFVYLSLMAFQASALSFHYNFSNPSDANDLTYVKDSTSKPNRVELTEIGGKWSVGRVVYRQPVRLWDSLTGKVANFTTRFAFTIGGNNTNRGDGMAFFIGPFTARRPPADSSGEYLGLFNNPYKSAEPSPPTVPVEFDTWRNPGLDPNDGAGPDHIGIDVNSIHSISTKELPKVAFYDKMKAVIDYDGDSKLMTVALRLSDGITYHVDATVDLKAAGLPQDAAVGFSAATGNYSECHQLHSWSFNSTDITDLPTTTGTLSTEKELPSSKTKSSVIMVLYIGCPLAAVLLAALVYTIYRRTRVMSQPMAMSPVAREFSYDELSAATQNFSESNKIGAGSLGKCSEVSWASNRWR